MACVSECMLVRLTSNYLYNCVENSLMASDDASAFMKISTYAGLNAFTLCGAGKAMSLAMTAHWVCNFAVGQFFDFARVQWGAAGIFAFFGAMCAVAVLYVKSSVPETKGRSLDEVQTMLS